MKKLAKFLAYLWPVIALSYIGAFCYYFVEWLEWIDETGDKFQMAISMPVFFLGIVMLFVIHYYYGKIVKALAR